MRVLCLHGMGTNADIFRAQTQSFRALLPPHFSFNFFDAERECVAADGIEEIYPEPYLCFYPVPTTRNIEDAHQYVWDLIDEEGPFDAVMGFSQGAALAASVLLQHQISKPFEPAPFRVAIFICGTLPYSLNAHHGVDVSGLFAMVAKQPRFITYIPSKDDGSARSIPLEQSTALSKFPARRQYPTEDIIDSGYQSEASDTESLDERVLDEENGSPVVRRIHPQIETARISIPTAHIYGKQDPYYRQSIELSKLCVGRYSSVYEHPEGHNVPRSGAVSRAIVSTIEKAVRMSEIIT